MNILMQQQILLDALFARPDSTQASSTLQHLQTMLGPQVKRGFMAYQANGYALAARSLLGAYPVIAELVGEDCFHALARDLWHRYPPPCGDLAQWGEALPAFLTDNEKLADVPYLADVARLEWALHRAASAPDADTDLPSFARLSSEDPEALTLLLAPGTALISSAWPVVSVITAHTAGEPTLAEAGRRLRDGLGETAVVWRQAWRPCVAACPENAIGVLQALLERSAVPEALARADPGYDFSDWLTSSVRSGLVIGVTNAYPRLRLTQKTP